MTNGIDNLYSAQYLVEDHVCEVLFWSDKVHFSIQYGCHTTWPMTSSFPHCVQVYGLMMLCKFYFDRADHVPRGCSRLLGISRRWGWARHLPGGWPDGGHCSTGGIWTQRRTALAHDPIPDLTWSDMWFQRKHYWIFSSIQYGHQTTWRQLLFVILTSASHGGHVCEVSPQSVQPF